MLACVLHEAGHIFMAKLCGVRIREICFNALGIHMLGDMATVSDLRRAAISLSGPLMNFLAFLCFLPLPKPYYALQLVLFVFHIVPALPLDGGTALNAALCSILPKTRADHICTALSVLFAFLLGTLGFWILLRTKGNFTLLCTAMYILFYVLMKRRGDLC